MAVSTAPSPPITRTQPFQNLEQLKAVVREDRMDIGVAFDGDGDRIGVIDHRGRILWGDQLMMLFAEEVLKSQPGRRSSPTSKRPRPFSTASHVWAASR